MSDRLRLALGGQIMKTLKLLFIVLLVLCGLALLGKAIKLAVSVAFIVGVIAIVMFFLKKKK